MATGVKSKNVDTDDIFDPYDGGTKPALTGYKAGSQDFRDRYSPRAEGDDIGHDTGLDVKNVDMRQIFAKKGTSTKAQVIPFGQYNAFSADSHDAGADFTLTVNRNGTWAIVITALHGGSATGTPKTGNWHKSPGTTVGDDYEVQFVASVTVNSTDGEPSYTPTTGWLRINDTRGVAASTGHLLGGGATSGFASASGNYAVRIRKVGGSNIVASICRFDITANVV
jgi:hypothetical protein